MTLGPTSRALLSAARDGLGPDDATAARVRAKVAAAIAGGAVLGVASGDAAAKIATGSSTGATAAVTTTGALKLKLALAVLALAGTGTAVTAIVARDASPAAAPQLAAPATAPISDEPAARVHVTTLEAAPAPAPAPATTASHDISLTREVALIDRAMAHLRVGDYASAVDAIHLYDHETAGRGQLAEDAAAIEIESRCRLHQNVATLLDAFDTRWPSSAQRTRLTAACSY